MQYEDDDFQLSLMGTSATKEIVQFRLDHLAELVETSKTQMTENAASESEIRVVEVADAAFHKTQWNKVKGQLTSFLEDFQEQRTKWKVLEQDVAHLLPRMRGRLFPLRGQMTVQRMDDATVPNLGK